MSAAVVSLGISLAGVCIAALLISLRNSALNRKVGDLGVKLQAEMVLHESAAAVAKRLEQEGKDREKRYAAHIAALRLDISYLEEDLRKCITPDATRARIERLLGKAKAAQDASGRKTVQN